MVAREATRALRRSKLRSGLSVLGVAVGIAAVICVTAIGAAASTQLQQQLHNLGDNFLWVEAGAARVAGVSRGLGSTKTLQAADAAAMLEQIPLLKTVSPNLDFSAQTIYGNQNWGTHIRGDGPAFFAIRNYAFGLGGSFSDEDVAHDTNVCVLGATVTVQLFGGENPIGRQIRIKNLPFTVVGTLLAKGQSGSGQDQDDFVVVPYTTAQTKLVGQTWLDDIFASVVSTEAIPAAEIQVTALLHSRHRIREGQPDDFKVRHPEEAIETAMAANRSLSLFLLTLGGISLLVGGIGIMNVMLAAVTERTREIGIRMAVGATEAEVTAQFLAEAVLLGLVGAVLGLVLGVGASDGLAAAFQWPLRVPVYGVLLAVGFAVAVGVGFGYYPARLAARLDPIEALRFE